jgi:hypothetical protein
MLAEDGHENGSHRETPPAPRHPSKSCAAYVALKYVDEVHKYNDALFQQNIQADLIGTDTDLSVLNRP